MKKIVFITPRDAEHGFHLAGVMQYVISATETEDTLRRVMKETDTGIVVIDERLMEGIDERKIRDGRADGMESFSYFQRLKRVLRLKTML